LLQLVSVAGASRGSHGAAACQRFEATAPRDHDRVYRLDGPADRRRHRKSPGHSHDTGAGRVTDDRQPRARIADVVAALSSPDCAWITGQVINAEGGFRR
jgi:NAD(P)-dependent dehydrogenase (short-subunit alcohol dehydrogenase family)